ncbi:ras-like GTP-binding protein Rho1 [Trichonephila clavipes]|nr:ras-like GTP-binding protein Rho1 [Trichonephila clavipes]
MWKFKGFQFEWCQLKCHPRVALHSALINTHPLSITHNPPRRFSIYSQTILYIEREQKITEPLRRLLNTKADTMLPGRKRTTSSEICVGVSDPKVLKLEVKDSSCEGLVENHVQIVVVGSARCGKTCLIKSFKREPWPPMENYRSTPCLVNIPFLGGTKKGMIWDLGATFNFLEARREAYQEADIILLCFSIVSEFTLLEQTEVWLQEIATLRPQTPIMLVGLKREMRYDRGLDEMVTEVEAIQLRENRELVAYMEASSLHNRGVVEIFEAAVRIAMERGLCTKGMWRNVGFRLPGYFPGTL